MARDIFRRVIAMKDVESGAGVGATNDLAPVTTNARAWVYNPGTTSTSGITIYAGRTGGTTKSNPLTVDANGVIEFWADAGEYDVLIEEQNTPARFTSYTIGWNSVPMSSGGIPTSKIATDGGISLAHLGADVLRQVKQIGELMLWWRPASVVSIPAGFEICDGRTIAAANHDFTGSGVTGNPIVLPDYRGVVPIGANVANADGSAGTPSNAVGNAPGIGGVGGSNVRDFRHAHTIPSQSVTIDSANVDHWHTIAAEAPGTGTESAFHTHTLSTKTFAVSIGSGTTVSSPLLTDTHTGGEEQPHSHIVASHNHTGNTGVMSQNATHTHTNSAHDHGGTTTATNVDFSAVDQRPKYYGALILMKVKRS